LQVSGKHLWLLLVVYLFNACTHCDYVCCGAAAVSLFPHFSLRVPFGRTQV
jgi:hypothetical protein